MKVKNREKVVARCRLRLMECVFPGHSGFADFIFRFDFIDGEAKEVCGSCCAGFSKQDNPRKVSEKLRDLADMLDDYWERALP